MNNKQELERNKKIRIAATTLIEGRSSENTFMSINDALMIFREYITHPDYLKSKDQDLVIILIKQLINAYQVIEVKNLEIYNRDRGINLIGKNVKKLYKDIDDISKDTKRKIKKSELGSKNEPEDEEEFSEEELDKFVDAVTEALGTKKKAKKGHK